MELATSIHPENASSKSMKKKNKQANLSSVNYRHEEQQYFKRELKQIINAQIKKGKLKGELEKDLEEYKKQKQNNIEMGVSEKEKLRRFYEEQDLKQQKKYLKFLEGKEKKQKYLKKIKENKIQKVSEIQRKRKLKEMEMKIKKEERENDVVNRSLNYFNETQPTFKVLQSPRRSAKSINRNPSEPYLRKNNLDEEFEKNRIKNYILKMKKCEQKVFNHEFEKQKRRQKSYFSSVKCLLNDRNQKQEQKIGKLEEDYINSVNMFDCTMSTIRRAKDEELFNKSIGREHMRKRVVEKKEKLRNEQRKMIQKKFEQKLYQTFNCKANKQKREKDEKNSELSYQRSMERIKENQKKEDHEKNMRYLYQKVQQIRKNSQNDKIPEKEQNHLMNFLDKGDKEYKVFKDFMENSKAGFVHKHQEEEEANKKKKQRKNS